MKSNALQKKSPGGPSFPQNGIRKIIYQNMI